MYPTLSDLLRDITGLNIPMGIQTFGMMMAVAFFFGAWTLSSELKRKEKEGILLPLSRKKITGKPISNSDILMSSIWGFLIGFKVLFIILNYRSCSDNPQQAIFSLNGNIAGGIIAAMIAGGMKYYERIKNKDRIQEESEELIHPYQLTGNIAMIAAVSGLLGAKVFDFLESPGDFSNILEDPAGTLFSGLTMYGGLIFGTTAVCFYAVRNGIKIPHISDVSAPGLMLAYGIGRTGCHLAGDGDWGIDNLNPKPDWLSFLPDWTWAYSYPHNVNNAGINIPGCVGKHCMILENPVFPTPFYEAFTCIVLFFFLWMIRKKITKPGMLFSIYLILNGLERFFIEKIRINSYYDILGHHITQAEIISTLLFFTGLAGVIYFNSAKVAAIKESEASGST